MSDARLRALLGSTDSAWLRRRVRERLAAGRPVTGSVTLREPSTAERAVLDGLLGRRPRSSGALSVRLEEVDEVLRAGAWPGGLADAVVHLDGPVTVRAEQAAAAESAWASLLAPLDEQALAGPWWAPWWAPTRGSASLRRTLNGSAAPTELIASLRRVLAGLPSAGEALGTFAQRTAGDPHALDGGPLAGLVLSALAFPGGPPNGAEERRAVWAGSGIALDDVSSTVLVAGFAGDGSPTGRALAAWREAGLPAVLTLRHVVAGVPPAGPVVHVCENPVVLRAALDAFGTTTPPLVCLSGRPSAAGTVLLRGLLAQGVRVRYHGDLDWGGLSIAGSVLGLGAQPWRLGVDDYRAAVRRAGRPLRGTAVATPWDVALGAEVERVGLGVDEEAVLDLLLDDLAGSRLTCDDATGGAPAGR
ncbi:TIGR02679 family protein [Kineococcus rhizosphaerae]|uniref:Uncharacterized protein (TIGR02679 family) n=1 Tax=Kineococcus rhizosphaerae TaxID=559628 RepID=A0A2T0QX64_9ACTN|nr:TIGR02679 family protein [Kineococcus rhizosphaerae]PRY10234.1 uncharacterized protein (TIGR02679 family) [Kineococcus rhizosphaerae]